MIPVCVNQDILRLADEYEAYTINCRRTIHTYAETAAKEFKTKAFIVEEVKKLGLPYEEVPTTGVIVKMETGRPGKTVALRADIDALPMVESETNLAGPRTCRSEQPETCHACGHDAHAAMLLGAMQILARIKDQLSGTLLFCFEEGEERISGIWAMLGALEKYHVDFCWGIHVYAGLEEGKISVDAGPRMTTGTIIDMTFHGKGGHASRPDLDINPMFCAANFLNNLCVAFTNQITAGRVVTMGLSMFHSGTAANIIDETARIQGSFRVFDVEEGEKAGKLAISVAEHTAAMHKCTVEISDMTGKIMGPALINDAQRAQSAAAVLNDILPAGTVVSCEPWDGSESFSLLSERYPGVFAFWAFGTKGTAMEQPTTTRSLT